MKKNLSRRFVTLGTALILSALTAFPALAISHAGYLDAVSSTSISGWAWDSEVPNSAVSVEVTISGESMGPLGSMVVTTPADKHRDDLGIALGSAAHGFVYEIDWSKYNAGEYTVTASAVSGETKTPLIGTIIYKKEETPAPAVSEPAISETDSQKTPIGPGSSSSAADSKKTPAGPGSSSSAADSKKTPTGPGSKTYSSKKTSGPSAGPTSSTKKKLVGPGTPAYETGEADEYLGTFHATAYCGCMKCSGGHTHTHSGTIPQANHTIAADLDLFPIGTKLLIDGIVYTVEDKGSNVVDNRVDIYFATHEEALAFGLQNVDVYSVK